ALEALEDRLMLDVQGLNLGGLQLYGDFTQMSNGTYSSRGVVQLGLTPAAGDAYTPLLDINPRPDTDANVTLASDPVHAKFTVAHAEFEAVIEGAPTPILWQTDTPTQLDAAALSSGGVNLFTGAVPFTVGTGEFTVENIRFASSSGGAAT